MRGITFCFVDPSGPCLYVEYGYMWSDSCLKKSKTFCAIADAC
nr:MAG TPA: hypothetical protein [Caudoviricetes sp.]